jgi:hypothetical protein
MGYYRFKIAEFESESHHSLSSPEPKKEVSRAFCGPKYSIANNSLMSRGLQEFEFVFLFLVRCGIFWART